MQRAPDDIQLMTAEQAATLKRLATAAYELDAYKPNLTRAEADLRIAALAAKLKLLGEPTLERCSLLGRHRLDVVRFASINTRAHPM